MNDILLEFFYKWHRLEKENGIEIIDFDLIQRGDEFPGAYVNRDEVKNKLKEIILQYKKLPDNNAFIFSKLIASKKYLESLMGEVISFDEYVKDTMGISPTMIPKEVLDDQLETTKNAYQKIDYSYSKEGIQKFKKENLLSKEEIENSFKSFEKKVLPEVIEWLGIKTKISYKIKFVDLDEYWMNWISTDKDGEILLRYNLNKRHAWLKGSTEFLVFHEICAHAIQTLTLKDQISKGGLDQFLGLTTVFSGEQFSMEGIAESLFYFYPNNPFTEYGEVSLHTDNMYWLTWNNGHIMANRSEDENKIIKYIQKYLPNLSDEEIQKNIKEKSKDPLGRTYQYIYGIALYYHKIIAEKLDYTQKKEFVLESFKSLRTPEQILSEFNI